MSRMVRGKQWLARAARIRTVASQVRLRWPWLRTYPLLSSVFIRVGFLLCLPFCLCFVFEASKLLTLTTIPYSADTRTGFIKGVQASPMHSTLLVCGFRESGRPLPGPAPLQVSRTG